MWIRNPAFIFTPPPTLHVKRCTMVQTMCMEKLPESWSHCLPWINRVATVKPPSIILYAMGNSSSYPGVTHKYGHIQILPASLSHRTTRLRATLQDQLTRFAPIFKFTMLREEPPSIGTLHIRHDKVKLITPQNTNKVTSQQQLLRQLSAIAAMNRNLPSKDLTFPTPGAHTQTYELPVSHRSHTSFYCLLWAGGNARSVNNYFKYWLE